MPSSNKNCIANDISCLEKKFKPSTETRADGDADFSDMHDLEFMEGRDFALKTYLNRE